MRAPETVTDAVRLLRAEGYGLDYQLIDGALHSEGRARCCPIDEAVVERLYRFEGASDPGDEMVVFGLQDPATGERGVLASAYGPAADPDVLDRLVGLASRFGGSEDGA